MFFILVLIVEIGLEAITISHYFGQLVLLEVQACRAKSRLDVTQLQPVGLAL